MNKEYSRDDSFIDRLASFFKESGWLNINFVKPIKNHVLYTVTEDGNAYILKGYRSKRILEQQWQFFEVVDRTSYTFIRFPNGSQYIKGYGFYWTMSPYIKGESLDYSVEEDRIAAVETIANFHHSSAGVVLDHPRLNPPLYLKWKSRIGRLEATELILKKHGYTALYQDIVTVMNMLLERFSQLDWHVIEKKAVDLSTWIHGDVASHNFLRDNKKQVHLIDFDLLSLSPQTYDYIQLGQRFLPYLESDLHTLLNHSLSNKVADKETWLLGVAIPADIIREWGYFLQSEPMEEDINDYLIQLTEEWMQRKKFVEAVMLMLN
ncbi:phosphotransferase [Radiobacillus sp. PE A8.2]|uniref:phosphotransferase n=1 Tax=Radiobacillus sp. PE A8.2 TaxID=3380349 RepID=UPI00388D181D